MAITDFSEDCYDSRMPLTRADKRNRDSQLAQAEFTKKQEKRELKRAAIMARKEAGSSDEVSQSVQKPTKPNRAKSSSDASDKSGGETGLDVSIEVNEARERGREAQNQKASGYSRTQNRKLSKGRQRDESSHGERRGKNRCQEDCEDDELFAAEAELAAARRRAVWQAKEERAEAALLAEAEKSMQTEMEKQEQDLLNALQSEAANAIAATAGAFTTEQAPTRSTQSRSRSRQRETTVSGMVVVAPESSKIEVFDADLDGWEIL